MGKYTLHYLKEVSAYTGQFLNFFFIVAFAAVSEHWGISSWEPQPFKGAHSCLTTLAPTPVPANSLTFGTLPTWVWTVNVCTNLSASRTPYFQEAGGPSNFTPPGVVLGETSCCFWSQWDASMEGLSLWGLNLHYDHVPFLHVMFLATGVSIF